MGVHDDVYTPTKYLERRQQEQDAVSIRYLARLELYCAELEAIMQQHRLPLPEKPRREGK